MPCGWGEQLPDGSGNRINGEVLGRQAEKEVESTVLGKGVDLYMV